MLLGQLQQIISVYTRAFLSQSVGLIGLFWCLFDKHPGLGFILTVLVLLDQAVFLRGRFAAENRAFPFQTPLNIWCLAVSAMDVVLLFAILFQAAGLRGMGSDAAVVDPFDFLAYTVATVFRLGSDLSPVNAAGRLLSAATALLGTAGMVAGGILLLTALLRRDRSA